MFDWLADAEERRLENVRLRMQINGLTGTRLVYASGSYIAGVVAANPLSLTPPFVNDSNP